MKVAALSLFLISLGIVTITHQGNHPSVKIDQGTLKGYYDKTWSGKWFSAFTSIPYAKPPIGDLRFKAPMAAGSWNGTLNANRPHNVCPQMNVLHNDYNIRGNEDCLYLNVYTPQFGGRVKTLLPVMFFIHGGGLEHGDANANSCGPAILLNKPIVLVTVNYRLGALGFLCTGDGLVPGNNGLKDQNLALKWVKSNIEAFGGNPNKVTIFGQSAGGASVHYHLLSPLSQGLFSAAIAHSGTAIAPWAFGSNAAARENARMLGRFLNCPTELHSNELLLDCLRKVDAYEIVEQDVKFQAYGNHPKTPFKPVVERRSGEPMFLPETPLEVMSWGNFAQVPFMSGITSEDGGYVAAGIYNFSTLVEELDQDWLRVAPLMFQYGNKNAYPDGFSTAIRNLYFGDKRIGNCSRTGVAQMSTDGYLHFPLLLSIFLHRSNSKQPIYQYNFGYRGSQSYGPLYGDPLHNYGVTHGDDLLYLLSSANFNITQMTDSDRKMIEIMSTLWTNFAATGNPTPQNGILIKNTWRAVHSNALEYFSIKNASNLEMKKNYNVKAYQLWEPAMMEPKH